MSQHLLDSQAGEGPHHAFGRVSTGKGSQRIANARELRDATNRIEASPAEAENGRIVKPTLRIDVNRPEPAAQSHAMSWPASPANANGPQVESTPESSAMSLLEVSHLRKTFGSLVAVEDVSFTVGAGEVFGLLGPNGAGKSTTMNMVVGLLAPDSGIVRLDGEELEPTNREVRQILGVVPQDLAIYPELTARENLSFFGRLYGIRGRELKERVSEALERTGLSARADDRADTFSGGMKRRLNFGVALLHRPRLLILDEPTVGVDPQSRAHLLECVRTLSHEGVAAVYASHYMEEVEALCQRVAIIDHGRVLACDQLETLLGRLQADLCLHVAKPVEGLSEKLDGLARIEAGSNGSATIVIPRENGQEDHQLSQRLARILQLLNQAHVDLQGIETNEANLERLFLEMTGSRLRD
jgi:ABC-2 type transport system ATP-binding protein